MFIIVWRGQEVKPGPGGELPNKMSSDWSAWWDAVFPMSTGGFLWEVKGHCNHRHRILTPHGLRRQYRILSSPLVQNPELNKLGRRPADWRPPRTNRRDSSGGCWRGGYTFVCVFWVHTGRMEDRSTVNFNQHILGRRETVCQSSPHQCSHDGRRRREEEMRSGLSIRPGRRGSLFAAQRGTLCFELFSHQKKTRNWPKLGDEKVSSWSQTSN